MGNKNSGWMENNYTFVAVVIVFVAIIFTLLSGITFNDVFTVKRAVFVPTATEVAYVLPPTQSPTNTPRPLPTSTPYPTYTPWPTSTPQPTYTPWPTPVPIVIQQPPPVYQPPPPVYQQPPPVNNGYDSVVLCEKNCRITQSQLNTIISYVQNNGYELDLAFSEAVIRPNPTQCGADEPWASLAFGWCLSMDLEPRVSEILGYDVGW